MRTPCTVVLSKWSQKCYFQPLKLSLRKCYVTDNTKVLPKSFDQISREMAERVRQNRKALERIRIPPGFLAKEVSHELNKILEPGDLVLLNLMPHIILRTPDTTSETLTLVDHVGLIKVAKVSQVDARLASLIPSAEVAKWGHNLYADDITGAPLKIVASDDIENNSMEFSLNKPTGKVVNWAIYRLVSMPLRSLTENATSAAHKILPNIIRSIEEYQREDVPTIIPFHDFLEKALDLENGHVSIINFYAARICLDHYSLESKYLLKLSYASTNAILILPKSMESRISRALAGKDVDDAFLLDYARGNLPSGSSEARAIECLRKKFNSAEVLDPGVAAELMNLPRGGIYENSWFEPFFKAAQNSKRSEKINECIRDDSLKDLREKFEEPVYCIDSADAKEIDDGISLKKVNKSTYTLGIHIANPSSFIDMEQAVNNILPLSSSIYLSNNETIPMLTSEVVNRSSLLGTNGFNNVLSLFVDLNITNGELANVKIKPLILSNLRNVDSASVSKDKQPFDTFYKVAQVLLYKRYNRGAFSFKNYIYDEPPSTCLGNRPVAEVIVTEFMILANHLAGKYCWDNDIPTLYRHQSLQLVSPSLTSSYNLQRKENKGLLGVAWQPFIQRGMSNTTPLPHTGMGVDIATRFTSPLRRLDDLITHFQIGSFLTGSGYMFESKFLAEKCQQIQLSQELSNRMSRQDLQYDTFSQLVPHQEVMGVVSAVDNTTKIPQRGGTVIYLPHQKVFADYVGNTPLNLETMHNFVVKDVSPAARSATVTLK